MAEKKGKSELTVTLESSQGLGHVEETLRKFSGVDITYPVSRWAEDLEDNAVILGWSDAQKLLVARRSLIGAAALWLKAEKTYRTYDELKAALVKEFPDTSNVKEMHEIMAARKKRKDETCYEYMLTMKELGKRAKFPDYVAIQYIIDGIVDEEMYKMMLYGVTTYPKLREQLEIYETIKEKGKNSQLDPRGF